MKTFETEKGNIPEGATHTYDHGGSKCGYYKLVDGNWFYWDWCKAWYALIDNQPFYDAIPIPQTNIETPEEKEVEWVNGDTVEYHNKHEGEGGILTFVGIHPTHKDHAVLYGKHLNGGYMSAPLSMISKPETEAELVERERDEFKVEICKDLEIEAVGCNTACIINKLYELGYRKGGE